MRLHGDSMKKVMLLFLASSLASNTGLAVTGRDSWQSIRQTPGLVLLQPKFAQAFGPRGLFNACITDEQFRSITPVNTCVLYKGTTCAESALQPVTMERVSNRKVCWEQVPSESNDERGSEKLSQEKPYEQPYEECLSDPYASSPLSSISFYIPVIERSKEGKDKFLFSKKYSLPACE